MFLLRRLRILALATAVASCSPPSSHEALVGDPSELIRTQDGPRRRLTTKQVQDSPYLVWNAFVSLVLLQPFQTLTVAQRRAHLAMKYDSEVQNGGHYQYFENTSEDRRAATVDALVALGLSCQAEILAHALQQWRSRERRPPVSADEFVANALLREFKGIDERYYRCRPATVDELKRHLESHRDDFVIVEP